MRQVCGLDVHKDSVFVCILNENGIVFQEKYGVLTTELEQMLEVMMQHDVTEVCMESTSVYWMPIWRVLENYIPKLMLVNPYFIKQLPGKKSDVKDAEWIATCLLKDLIKGSYVPEDRIQQLRQYDRRIFDLNKEIAYKLIKLDMALQRCNIRISNYVATTDGKSYQDVVRLISEGKTSPEELAKVIHGRIVNKHGRETIVGALTGVISETDIAIIRQLREEILLDQKHKDECQSKMNELCQKWFPTQLENLQTIPGVKTRSATAIIAELGTDMSSFEDAAHLVSWCGLKPRNEESAGKIKSRSITHGNKYLRKTLIECSWASSKTQGCFYNKFSYIQTVVRRKNKMKVQVAIARKMLSAIWFILHDNVAYRFIGLISVSGAAAEDSTTADAVGWAPGKTVAIAERSALSTDFPYGQSGIRQPSLARSKTCQSPPHGYPQQVASTPLHTNPNPSSVALPPRERSCAHAAAHISEHKKLKTAGHILRSSRAELVAAHKQPATCEQFHHFPPSQKNSKFFINFFPLFATYI